MSKQPNPDYEKLYHLMNSRRGLEKRMLQEMHIHLHDLYSDCLHKESCVRLLSATQERLLYNEIIVELARLMDTFNETDRKLEDCAITQGEPTLSVIPGRKEIHESQKSTHC